MLYALFTPVSKYNFQIPVSNMGVGFIKHDGVFVSLTPYIAYEYYFYYILRKPQNINVYCGTKCSANKCFNSPRITQKSQTLKWTKNKLINKKKLQRTIYWTSSTTKKHKHATSLKHIQSTTYTRLHFVGMILSTLYFLPPILVLRILDSLSHVRTNVSVQGGIIWSISVHSIHEGELLFSFSAYIPKGY